jgi:hypothetical protein
MAAMLSIRVFINKAKERAIAVSFELEINSVIE